MSWLGGWLVSVSSLGDLHTGDFKVNDHTEGNRVKVTKFPSGCSILERKQNCKKKLDENVFF